MSKEILIKVFCALILLAIYVRLWIPDRAWLATALETIRTGPAYHYVCLFLAGMIGVDITVYTWLSTKTITAYIAAPLIGVGIAFVFYAAIFRQPGWWKHHYYRILEVSPSRQRRPGAQPGLRTVLTAALQDDPQATAQSAVALPQEAAAK